MVQTADYTGLKLPTCSSETFLPTSADREVVVGACEAATTLSRSRTLFGGGRILGGMAYCACFLSDSKREISGQRI
jgi:hypothetical protein